MASRMRHCLGLNLFYQAGNNSYCVTELSRNTLQSLELTSGVPQGTVLGPLLFLLHVNDMRSVVDPRTSVRLFVDDTLIYRVIDGIEDQVALQRDLASLEQWAST